MERGFLATTASGSKNAPQHLTIWKAQKFALMAEALGDANADLPRVRVRSGLGDAVGARPGKTHKDVGLVEW
jgi:hypothetical protein